MIDEDDRDLVASPAVIRKKDRQTNRLIYGLRPIQMHSETKYNTSNSPTAPVQQKSVDMTSHKNKFVNITHGSIEGSAGSVS